ncbi:hypothetical protein KC460_04595 [Candidatus Dependentiae bacterium]|nr:hypothetical protein [Candidatus Dependentiae bacterium]
MIRKHRGIVLRRYTPRKSKIIVLDRELGKIESIPHVDILCHGAVIEYFPKKMCLLYKLESFQLIVAPLHFARDHIQFLHHVLELTYYFVPLDSRVPEIFDLLLFLYRMKNSSCTATFQKLFVCKFFALLGFFPENKKMRQSYFHQLVGISIDTLVQLSINLEVEYALQQWIYSCVAQHPRARFFKTIHWLKPGEIP